MKHPVTTPADAHALRVLLVDDDSFVLELMADMLRSMGVPSIQVAQCGIEGLAAYQKSVPPPNVIICDLCMPRLGGMDFLSELAKERCQAAIAIISGHNRTPPNDPNWQLAKYDGSVLHLAEKMARLQGLKVRGTFEKPITRETMAEIVQRVCSPAALAVP